MAKIGTRKKSGFIYRERDEEETKKRAKESGSRYESPYQSGVDIFTAKGGTNTIRILPPTWPNAKHYGYTIFVHAFVGAENSTFLCLSKMGKGNCSCCEAYREAKSSGDEEEAKALSWREKVVYWVIDRDGDEDIPLLYDVSRTRDNELIDLATDTKTGKLSWIDHPDEGYDISFKRVGKGLTTKYTGTRLAKDSSPINEDEKIQQTVLDFIEENPIPSILKFYDYEHMEKSISGTAEAKDKDLDDSEEERPTRKRRNEPEEEEEMDENTGELTTKNRRRGVDETEEEEEESPPPRKRGRQPEPEEEEDEPPRRRSKAVAEEEEEEEETPRRRRSEPEEEEEEGDDDTPPLRKSQTRNRRGR